MPFPLELKKLWVQDKPVELYVPEPAAVKERYKLGDIAFPYWSQIWPSAVGLSEFLLKHPQYIQNKKLLELAAGLGLPSIIAARFATSVICSDYITDAVEIIGQSAMHNRLTNFYTALLDWSALPANIEAEVLLLSDINYDPHLFKLQLEMIRHFLSKGTTIILSTPQRLMAKEFIQPLLAWCRRKEDIKVHHHGNDVEVTVVVLQLH